MKTIELKIEGMTCDHCEMTVKKALSKLPGVSNIEVSRFEKNAKFTADENQFNMSEAKSAIEAIGFQLL